MTIKLNAQAQNTSGVTTDAVLVALVKQASKVLASGVTALTDSSGGTASVSSTLTALSVALTNAANSGTSLAQKAATETALGTVNDAIKELYTKANEYATKLGLDNITYSGGGSATDGTVAAVTVATTAATTGVQASNVNTIFGEYNVALYKLGVLVNRIATALGVAGVVNLSGYTYSDSVAAFTTSTGTSADPGVTQLAIDAQLVVARTNIATIATVLNTFNDGVTTANVVAV
jgi:hypothetical protein